MRSEGFGVIHVTSGKGLRSEEKVRGLKASVLFMVLAGKVCMVLVYSVVAT